MGLEIHVSAACSLSFVSLSYSEGNKALPKADTKERIRDAEKPAQRENIGRG